nr:N-acetylmuramoyl-L-alanine amidase [Nocardioides thalensis]
MLPIGSPTQDADGVPEETAEAPSGTDSPTPGEPGTTEQTEPTETPERREERERRKPLAGRVVVLDPGHQLGNSRFPREIGAPVDAGGFEKPCNTTGTSTDGGYAEATFVWEVALRVRRLLERDGARVLLTRDSNSEDEWGPCVDDRGRAGNPDEPGPTADVKLSIHADGTYADGARGFHVIAPGRVEGYTDDIGAESLDLAVALRDRLVAGGFVVSTYTAEDGLDVRTDLGTLNLSDVPTAMVELGNMRDPAEAEVMTSEQGQRQYARALARGLVTYLR